MSQYDVAIIGCGVQGASAALHLAERGARTVVLEQGAPACGPTGRSSAVVRGYYVNEFLAKAARDSLELFKSFSDWTHGGEARFSQCGALYLHPADDGPRLQSSVARLNAIGTKTEVLDREQLGADFPRYDLDGIGWAVWEQNAGYADPSGTTTGMINRAVQLGAGLLQATKVTGIDHTTSPLRLTTADGRTMTADKILLAAGPWSSSILAMVGATLPLWAERHLIATYKWGNAEPVPFVWASVPDGIYVKPEVHAQYLVGTLWEEPHADPESFATQLSEDERTRITAALVNRLPDLSGSLAFSGYSDLYDVSPDWQPVIGQVAENVFIVAGTSGHGFKWAPAMGGHVADLVLGADVDPELAQFDPARFSHGEVIEAGYGDAKILG